MYDTATPFIASFVVFRKGKEAAFVLRKNTGWMNGYYGLPSGKVEKGESFSECAIREAKEEVGVDIRPEDLKAVLVCHRHGDDSEWVDVVFEAEKWSGELYNAEPDVHGELTWLDIENLSENVIPSVRHYFESINSGKIYTEYGWGEEGA